MFTTSAVDNIDHNPSSTTATGSFHGTGVSLFQHPDFDKQGTEMNNVTIRSGSSKCINLCQTSIHTSPQLSHPDQIPVLACDQPLYAIAKNIQCPWPSILGEDKLLIMFGGLHIEMAAWKAVGTWMDGSGWTDALIQAEVGTSGKAD